MYKQLIDANINTPYTGGWCLKFVQDAFVTDHPYPSATDAWNDNYGGGNHPGELPPSGLTVPVYFSLGSEPAGHVAISLDDLAVASSTLPGYHESAFIHSSMQDMINTYAAYNGGCDYLGWSEYVGTRKVVDNNEEKDVINKDNLEIIYGLCLGRAPDADGIKHYVGNYSASYTLRDVYLSKEAESYRINRANREDSFVNKINSLENDNKKLQSDISLLKNKLDEVIVNYTKQIDQLNNKILELENNKTSLDDYTLGQLLSESVKKIFRIK